MSRWSRVLMVLVALGGLLSATVAFVPGLRWRAGVVELKLSGHLSSVSWGMLLGMLEPGSRFYLKPLLDTPNPNVVIQNPYTSSEDVEHGEAAFDTYCSRCHGAGGRGATAGVPNLAGGTLNRGNSDWALFRTIRDGVPGTAMSAHALPDSVIWSLAAYVRHLLNEQDVGPEKQTRRIPTMDITTADIVAAGDTSGDWLTYSKTYDAHRYSGLTSIERNNVKQLTLKWAHQLSGGQLFSEATPIVARGVMYTTEPPGKVTALDAATGDSLWSFDRDTPNDLSLCCGTVNRGVAVLGGKVFVGTLDAHLLALDARTGELLWDKEVASYKDGYSITGAPLAVQGMVVTGIAGGEFGVRGFIDAYDADSGARLWRFNTVPQPGEPASETWEGDSWERGGAPTWLTGAFDPQLNLIYWGVGNPGPEFNGDSRTGDNLYSNSVVALNAGTGELKWYFQFTPHDEHDWDAVQIPLLFEAKVDGREKRLLGWANRNGFYYILDRKSGEYLKARSFVRQTWADGMDSTGRPIMRSGSTPTREGALVYPGVLGGTNWWSPSLDPESGLVFVPYVEQASIYFKEPAEYTKGEMFQGSTAQPAPGEPRRTGVVALVETTGDIRWRTELQSVAYARPTGGVLSTAGNLVFAGSGNVLYGLDSATGAVIWETDLGGVIFAGPIAYRAAGEERISVMAGRTLYTFGLP